MQQERKFIFNNVNIYINIYLFSPVTYHGNILKLSNTKRDHLLSVLVRLLVFCFHKLFLASKGYLLKWTVKNAFL
jgi:hypothetical protein